MKSFKSWWLLFAQAVAILSAAALVWQLFWRPPQASYADTLAQVLPSVVGVYGRRAADLPPSNSSIGSGVIVGGYILTNYHLIANMAAIEVDAGGGRHLAEVVGVDPDIDLAVLRVPEATFLPSIVFADDDDLRQGDVVFAIGNPFGLQRSASMGIVSAVGRKSLGLTLAEDFIQTDAAINPGSSGGALTNTEGELVGINSALFASHSAATPQGIGFAVRAGAIRRSLAYFVSPSPVSEDNAIGAEVRPISERLQDEILDFRPDSKPVMLVSRIWPGTPAAVLGLLPGDIVLQVNGVPPLEVSETGVLPEFLRNITVLRAGEKLFFRLPQ